MIMRCLAVGIARRGQRAAGKGLTTPGKWATSAASATQPLHRAARPPLKPRRAAGGQDAKRGQNK